MAKRYVIWDEKCDVITPSGAVYSAEEWMIKYPMSRLESIDLVLSGGVINGALCYVYQEMVDRYSKYIDFSECTTKQECLDLIEAFEDDIANAPEVHEPTSEERIAAALEAQVMLAMPDGEAEEPVATYGLRRTEEPEEEEFSYVKKNYETKLWSLALVKIAVKKGIITRLQYFEITGREYE